MADVPHTGGMIALIPAIEAAQMLLVPGGDEVDELHLTLGYLGDDVTGWNDDDKATLGAELRELVGGLLPIEARVFGHAVFNPDGFADRKPCAVYLVGEAPMVAGLHREVDALLARIPGVPPGHPNFVPHITAGFGVDVADLTFTGPVLFDRVRLALAGEHIDIPLHSAQSAPIAEIEEKALPKTQKCAYCAVRATKRLLWAEGRAYIPTCETHERKARRQIEVTNSDEVVGIRPIEEKGEAVNTGDIEFKNKVASEAGEKRYGKPIGTELGQARQGSKPAADVQNDARAKEMYEATRGMSPADLEKYTKNLSDDDIKKLHAITYSFKSSDKNVVANRVALGKALRQRGFNPAEHGALNGTGAGAKKTTSTAKKTPAKTDTFALKKKYGSKKKIRLGSISESEWDKLRAAGWKGRAGDSEEALYPPDNWLNIKGADDVDTETADLDDVELKRTTTKPWETRKAQRGGKTIGADKSDEKGGGDEYPVKTIGDIAAGVKRAKAIKDPARKAEVMAHLRKGAKAIGGPAVNMVPKDGADDSGKGKSGGGGNPFAKKKGKSLYEELAQEIELKVMSPDPHAAKLREYWAHGKGRAKWNPGTPGDFKRLRSHLKKYVKNPRVLNGLTANIHKLATGKWPGAGNGPGRHKTGEPDNLEAKATITRDMLDAVPQVDDAEDALDGYAAMDITSEDAYEEALAAEVEWDDSGDGTLEPAEDSADDLDDLDDPADEVGIGDPDEWDDDELDIDALDDVDVDAADDVEPDTDEVTDGIDALMSMFDAADSADSDAGAA